MEKSTNSKQFKKGYAPWNKGKKLGKNPAHSLRMKGRKTSDRTKKLMSEAQKGEKGSNWQGGISPMNEKMRRSLEYRLWHRAVLERDGYACIWCGAKNGNGKAIILEVDHIKRFNEYPELRFAIDNGRTLCKPCHRTTGTWGRP